jgi:hypothetical protein
MLHSCFSETNGLYMVVNPETEIIHVKSEKTRIDRSKER